MNKLTNIEVDSVTANAQRSFGALSAREAIADLYRARFPVGNRQTIDGLWLWVYALNSWDNNDITNNYMTEAQMLKIVSKVQRSGSKL